MTLKNSKRWVFPQVCPDDLKTTVYKEISKYQAQLLFNRDILEVEKINAFVKPDLSEIEKYRSIFNAKAAAKQIVKAIEQNEKIFIHGDFDVDGVCATAILWEFLYKELSAKLGKQIDVKPYIPDRIDEGYGLSETSISSMLEQGARLVISVDCGIRDKSLVEKYQTVSKIKFIITDHHQIPEEFSIDNDYIIVHPAFPGKECPNSQICGAFISYLLVEAIREYYSEHNKIETQNNSLDLVALATVGDMMPLLEVNRTLVSFGLKAINDGKRIGLNKLIEVAGCKIGSIESYHLGFVIGPRINAAGRIGSAMEALRLLVSDSIKNAEFYGEKLNALNINRQSMTKNALESARIQAIELIEAGNKFLFVKMKSLHEGIVGLVAGKLQEEFSRPVIVATTNEDETRGSARSIKGFNITDAISKFSAHLVKYGGHSQAAGFTVKPGMLEEFSENLVNYANSEISEDALIQDSFVDLELKVEDLEMPFYYDLNAFQPYGYGNKKPQLFLGKCVVVEKKVMGQNGNHMRLKVKDDTFGFGQLIMFNVDEDVEQIKVDDVLDFIGTLDINEWNGNTSLQFLVKGWRETIIKA